MISRDTFPRYSWLNYPTPNYHYLISFNNSFAGQLIRWESALLRPHHKVKSPPEFGATLMFAFRGQCARFFSTPIFIVHMLSMCKEVAITISIKPVLVGVAISWVRRCMVIVWPIKGMPSMPQIMMSVPALIPHALMVPLRIPWRSCYTFMAHWRSMWLFLTQPWGGRWKWNSQVWKISSKQVELESKKQEARFHFSSNSPMPIIKVHLKLISHDMWNCIVNSNDHSVFSKAESYHFNFFTFILDAEIQNWKTGSSCTHSTAS